MPEIKTKIESSESDKEYYFDCHENDKPIEIGDYYLFYFAGVVDVGYCQNENEKYEINPNDRKSDPSMVLDLVTGFWKNCYKIKETDFDYNKII